MAQCTAKSKRSGQQCKKSAVDGFAVCEIHGGKTPKGAASPQFKDGRYSKHLPNDLRALYEEAKNDPDLLSVRQDIQLIDTLLAANIKKLDSDESGAAWEAIRKSIDHLDEAFANENYGKCLILMRAMRDVVDARILHYATEAEIRSKLNQRRQLVESEQKIALQSEHAITPAELMVFMGAVVEMINRKIPDAKQRNDILTSIDELMGQGKGAIQ